MKWNLQYNKIEDDFYVGDRCSGEIGICLFLREPRICQLWWLHSEQIEKQNVKGNLEDIKIESKGNLIITWNRNLAIQEF